MNRWPADIYTPEGLAWLKQELARKEDQWDNYSGNNPNKGAAERRSLRDLIGVVTETLKAQGVIELTEAELLKRKLDAQTPSRLKGCCTQLEGAWYKIKFTGKNERGAWEWTWLAVSDDEVQAPGSYVHPGPGKRKVDPRKTGST